MKLILPTLVSVPWKSREQLMKLYGAIYLETDVEASQRLKNLRWAREALILWKIRNPSSPDSVEFEVTASLVSATIKDSQRTMDMNKEGSSSTEETVELELATLYAMACIKFCDLLSYYQISKIENRDCLVRNWKKSDGSVLKNAQSLGIPAWMIQCRHDACHSSIPPLSLLRQAATIGLDWLSTHFWQKRIQETDMSESNLPHIIDNFLANPKPTYGKLVKDALTKNKTYTIELIQEALYRISTTQMLFITESEITAGQSVLNDVTKLRGTPLLAAVAKVGQLHLLLSSLISDFHSDVEMKKSHSVVWFFEIAKAYAEPSTSKLGRTLLNITPKPSGKRSIKSKKTNSNYNSYTPNGPLRVLWLKLLHRTMQTPVTATPLLMDYLVKIVPDALPNDQAKDCGQLINAFLRTQKFLDLDENKITKTGKGGNQSTVKTLADVEKLIVGA